MDFWIAQLLPLLIYGVPIAFGIRWIVRQRHASNARFDNLPTQAQFEALTDRLESLADRLDALDERQLFTERLLRPAAENETRRLEPTHDGADSA